MEVGGQFHAPTALRSR